MSERFTEATVLTEVRRLRIAVDGPAGSGKSSVARALAERLATTHLDTGAIYRAITLACLRADVDLEDGEACAAVARSARITQLDGVTSLEGADVEAEIRGDAVSASVSVVSAHASVREVLLTHQRALAAEGAVVEGRDIGTVVLPDAELKVLLTASAEERARRRAAQLGREEDVASLQAAIVRRDELDSTREVAPLRAADDAWVLDTTDMPFEDVVGVIEARALAIARQRLLEASTRPRRLPRVAIVGRPNVGKSTLVNRILRERVTIVEAEPGVTRDRTEHVAVWDDHEFVLVDTGGWEQGAEGAIGRAVVGQTEAAIASADVVVQIVDITVGILDDDERVARTLRRSGAATLLVVNKVDREADVAMAAEHVRLGLGSPLAISARNGRGVEELLDAVVAALPEAPGRGAPSSPLPGHHASRSSDARTSGSRRC